MLLAVDVGNSNISLGVFDISDKNVPECVFNFKISSREFSADELTILIKDFLARNEIYDYTHSAENFKCVDASVISSVVPSLTETISLAAQNLCGKPSFIIASGIRTGFGIRIKNPEQLGTDIVSNVAAALQICESPLVVLDMGTATTITVVDYKKNILGTIIIPGIKISLNALNNSAAQISETNLGNSPELIGRDTSASICSGIVNGNALMIDGFIRNIREELSIKENGQKLGLVATGGLAAHILPCLRNKFVFDEILTLKGLAILYCENHI